MADVFEIAKKLRRGEEVIIHNKYRFIVMQQMAAHEMGCIAVEFKPHDKNHLKLTLAQAGR